LSFFQPEVKLRDQTASHGLSKSSIGYAGMVTYLRGLRFPTRLERSRLNPDLNRTVLVMTPPVDISAEEIASYPHTDPLVLILPKWQATGSRKGRGWVVVDSILLDDTVSALIPEAWQGSGFRLASATGSKSFDLTYQSYVYNVAEKFGRSAQIERPRAIYGDDWFTVVAGPDGGALIAKNKNRNVYVVADPDLMNNAGIANVNQARLLAYFFNDIGIEDKQIVFDLTLNGMERQPNLIRLLYEPPFLGASLCLMLGFILIAAQALVRFQPARDPTRAFVMGKTALADNTAGLILMGQRETSLAMPYADLVRSQVMKALGIAPREDKAHVHATLDRASQMVGSQLRVSDLIETAERVATTQDLLQVSQRLQQWKQEMTGERQ
jgi:hypothetical protein